MRNIRAILIVTFLPFYLAALSQAVVVTDVPGYTVGHASSMLDIYSTTKGLLFPRVTLTSSLASASPVTTPATGLLVYNEGANQPLGFYYWNGSAWTSMGVAASADGSETKISSGTSVSVTGSGTTGTPYVINYKTQTVTYSQRGSLTPATSMMVFCSDCGTSGELQVWNGTAWTNITGGASLPYLATVTTTAESNKKSTTVTAGGNVTSDAGGTVTARGVCWSTSVNPTITDRKTTDGAGTGSFSSSLTVLFPSTTYYLRAYATNSAGTAYGSNISFTTNAYAIGDPCQGGVVAYLNGAGGGLIAATSDQSTGTTWGCFGTNISGAEGTSVFTGKSNTSDILAGCATAGIAARLCADLSLNGYNDWYLPSKDELAQLCNNRVAIGGFNTDAGTSFYWSSSEWSSNPASSVWDHYFYNNTVSAQSKNASTDRVRAVRSLIGVGSPFQGGVVAYVYQPGEPGYVAGEIHGFVVSATDVSTSSAWGCYGSLISGADGTALGTGNQNTTDIDAGCSASGIAADICINLTLNNYSDWYLPSKDELNKIWLNRAAIGTFAGNYYWSSSEDNAYNAWYQWWSDGTQATGASKLSGLYVRAIRSF